MMIFSEQIATVIQQIERSSAPDASGEENLNVQTQLVRLERMKKLFMMSINHEVHTRISTILSQVQRLKFGNDSLKMNERSALINSILEQTTHLKESMAEIMDLSRLEGEDITLDLYSTSINELVQETTQSYREQSIRKGLQVSMRLEEDLPLIYCDSMKIRRVIANLISNAIKFSTPGGTIQINTDQRENEVVFEVTDTGMGIPADEQGQIFELFSRSERVMEQSIQGLGVGLYLVKRFVDLHKGRVWFESTANRGSMFAIALPTNLGGELPGDSNDLTQAELPQPEQANPEPTHPRLIRLNPKRAA
jgi:K+-sensing histidine kinase KdpD